MSAAENPMPMEGVVDTLHPLPDGRVRVTFKRLASPYFVAAAGEEREPLLRALEASLASGEPVPLAWSLPGKELTLRPA